MVSIKYIIIPEVNDSMEEVKKFIEKCRQIECEKISFRFDVKYLAENNNRLFSDELKKTVNYLCSQKDIDFNRDAVIPEYIICSYNFNIDINNLLKDRKINLNILINAGTEELFKEINDNYQYKNSWENIAAYLENSKMSDSKIMLLYDIIPNKNDIETEIEAFITRSYNFCCNSIGITTNNKFLIPEFKEYFISFVEKTRNKFPRIELSRKLNSFLCNSKQ